MSTGLSAFAQGFARSPMGNLAGLLQAKRGMELQREQMELQRQRDEELTRQWNEEMEFRRLQEENRLAHQGEQIRLGEGELAVRQGDLAVRRSDAESQDRYRTGQLGLQESKFGLEEDAYNRSVEAADRQLSMEERARFAQQFLSTWDGTPEGLARQLPNLRRRVEQNPDFFSGMHYLGEGRTPLGYEMVKTPDGEKLAMRVSNASTGTEGPMTRNASADPNDDVIYTTPADLRRMVASYGGIADPALEARAPMRDGNTVFKNVTGPDGGLYSFDPLSGGYKEYNRTQPYGRMDFNRIGVESVQAYARSKSIGDLSDHEERVAIPAIMDMAFDFQNPRQGVILDPSMMGPAIWSILKNEELSKDYYDAETEEDRAAAMRKIAQMAVRAQFLPPPSMGGADGLSAVSPTPQGADPRATMPRRSPGLTSTPAEELDHRRALRFGY